MLEHYTANEKGRKAERQKGRKARGTRQEGRKALSPRLEALK